MSVPLRVRAERDPPLRLRLDQYSDRVDRSRASVASVAAAGGAGDVSVGDGTGVGIGAEVGVDSDNAAVIALRVSCSDSNPESERASGCRFHSANVFSMA